MSSTNKNQSGPVKIISSLLNKSFTSATGAQLPKGILESEVANKALTYALKKLSPYHMARTLIMLQFGDKKQAIEYAIKHARKDI
jgi:hypothetical protein